MAAVGFLLLVPAQASHSPVSAPARSSFQLAVAPASVSVASSSFASCPSTSNCSAPSLALKGGSALYVVLGSSGCCFGLANISDTGNHLFSRVAQATTSSVLILQVYVSDSVAPATGDVVKVTTTVPSSFSIGVLDLNGTAPRSVDSIGAVKNGSSKSVTASVVPNIAGDFVLLSVTVGNKVMIAASGGDRLIGQAGSSGLHSYVTLGELSQVASAPGNLSVNATLNATSSWVAVAIAVRAVGSVEPQVSVSGRLDGFRGVKHPLVPMGGVNVTAVSQYGCLGTPSPTSCPYQNSTTTDALGDFRLNVSAGSYFLFVPNSSAFGGAVSPVSAGWGGSVVNLRVYPYRPYGNATYLLPAWSNLTGYVDQPGATQNPVTSWTQDGAFYVNATDTLVFYSFANRSVQAIARWVPLYTNVMAYAGVENEEFATQDGSYVYGFGCLSACLSSSPVTFEAVNVSTGARSLFNFTGFKVGNTTANFQANLVGYHGNDSIAVAAQSNGQLWEYSLWNHTEWAGARLPFFEANNLYWVPFLNGWINIQAEGSSADGLQEWQITPGGSFVRTFNGIYANAFRSDAVDGWAYNVSSHRFMFTSASHSLTLTDTYSVDPGNGTLLSLVHQAKFNNPSFPNSTVGPTVTSDQFRGQIITSGPVFTTAYSSGFYNDSFLDSPTTGLFYDTNQSPFPREVYYPNQANALRGFLDSWAVDGLFVNASYLITPDSYTCTGFSGRVIDHQCPIRGTAAGTQAGTVYWLWQMGLPALPFPATASLSQSRAPSAPVLTVSPRATALLLSWSTPIEGANPIVNYTLEWGPANTGISHAVNLPGGAHRFTIGNLQSNWTYAYQLTAWNLHWAGTPASGMASTGPLRPQHPMPGPGAPGIVVSSPDGLPSHALPGSGFGRTGGPIHSPAEPGSLLPTPPAMAVNPGSPPGAVPTTRSGDPLSARAPRRA
ncbi:MAG: fibronectin type III domain-containing protein [Thermoplasmata archaeon]|nr:fibronectin type III domain-containing protein [Thermoplasmata archaeon]